MARAAIEEVVQAVGACALGRTSQRNLTSEV